MLTYTIPACKTCGSKDQCTKQKQNGRAIDRSEYDESMEQNNERVIAHPNYYRQRQQLAEHPLGTLKRQKGFTFTLMRGKEKVLGEVGLEFIGYNLTRCISILGSDQLCKTLRKSCFNHFPIKIRLFLSHLGQLIFGTIEKPKSYPLKLLPVYCA